MVAGMIAQRSSPVERLNREVRELREAVERGPAESDEEQRRALESMMAEMREKEKLLASFRPLDAVLAAVHLHGLAGDLARERMGEPSLIATDLLGTLPAAFEAAQERALEKFVRISG
jgi:NAD(P)H-hydrate repair Nnr-like enzyme with NAD(P)H-hydrate dehydratase domain